ncbi:mechanosensitive ion channel family protein [Hydrogenibacillus schlegelii]|uniref:mechanosensitive ion channel family protein n=1 Tax=Hydrogenibacillus schlegelii TaxID=1484 RepID=UPI002355E62E|nr:mechanosensitive ion channel family protein [Hydrogenibacillus schlegelii]
MSVADAFAQGVSLTAWLGPWGRPVGAVLVLGALLGLGALFSRTVGRRWRRALEAAGEDKAVWKEALLAAGPPARLLWAALAVTLAAAVCGPPPWVGVALEKGFRAAVIVAVFWGLYRLVDRNAAWLRRLGARHGAEFQATVVPLLSVVLRFTLVAVGATVLLQEFGYRIDSLIAGLGLGGLAVSLAAKDTLANLFAGAVILIERTFAVGDWIETPDVSGTVEAITIRSTKIRTFDQGLVTVPNANLVGGALKNWSRMGRRRTMYRLLLDRTTPPEALARFVARFRAHLQAQPDVVPDAVTVAFEQVTEAGFSVLVTYYTRSTQYDAWLQINERLNLDVLRFLEEEGIALAMPERVLVAAGASPWPEGATGTAAALGLAVGSGADRAGAVFRPKEAPPAEKRPPEAKEGGEGERGK